MDNHRIEKIHNLRNASIEPYVNSFKVTSDIGSVKVRFTDADNNDLLNNKYKTTIAGRITAMRNFGKASFLTIRDRTDALQVYVKATDLTDQEKISFENTDIGDFIGVSGYIFKTKTGELTVYAESFKLLTKALRDLPEKWHGLKDIETRQRQRYVDLIVNADVRERFKKEV